MPSQAPSVNIRVMGLKTVATVTAIFSIGTWPAPLFGAQTSSESERLEKLERAVQQLQERNAELEQEVRSLKKQTAAAPEYDANGNKKPKAVSDGKTYLEKPIIEEKCRSTLCRPGRNTS